MNGCELPVIIISGSVKKGVEATILNVGKLAKKGMKEIDKEIIKIMIEN